MMSNTRKEPSDPTFHPSRDEPHWIGDETKSGQQVLLDQGEHPYRTRLFGGPGGEGNTSRLRPAMPSGVGDPKAVTRRKEQLERIERVGQSTVPTSHWQRSRGPVNVGDEGMEGAAGFYRPSREGSIPLISVARFEGGQRTMIHEMGHAHHFTEVTNPKEQGNPSKIYRDERGFSPDPLEEAVADAYVDRYGGHESAHQKLAERHRTAKASNPDAPEPGKYDHISDRQFGYSSHYEVDSSAPAWGDADRALYAGVRAHFDATGEIPRYQQPPGRGEEGSATDATIAMLHQHSPHAREAWANVRPVGPTVMGGAGEVLRSPRKFTDIADQAVRRHQDRRLLNEGQYVQPSMFHEMIGFEGAHDTEGTFRGYVTAEDAMAHGDTGDKMDAYEGAMDAAERKHGEAIWPRHMNKNQFGETPRAAVDVGRSVGIPLSAHPLLKKKGFV